MTTGTIKLKGTFKNTDHKLWPGQYANVTLRLAMRSNALVVPNQAVQSGQDGTFVYVVNDDRTVAARPVVTGPRVDQEQVIDKGLGGRRNRGDRGSASSGAGSRVQMRDTNGGGGGRDGGDGKERPAGRGRGKKQSG